MNKNKHTFGKMTIPLSHACVNEKGWKSGRRVRAVESKELIKIMEKMHDNVLSAQKWAIASLLCSATALVVSVILLSLQ